MFKKSVAFMAMALGGLGFGNSPYNLTSWSSNFNFKAPAPDQTRITTRRPKSRGKARKTGGDFRRYQTVGTLQRDHYSVSQARRKAANRRNVRAHSSKRKVAA